MWKSENSFRKRGALKTTGMVNAGGNNGNNIIIDAKENARRVLSAWSTPVSLSWYLTYAS